MTDRERLIELLKNAKSAMKAENLSCDIARNMFIVDFIMANGVIVPPCNVGDTVYYISFGKVYKGKCHAICLQPSLQIHLYDFDGDNATYPAKDVFTSKEEAERALKEREQNDR